MKGRTEISYTISVTDDPDEELVRQTLAGSEAAYSLLVGRYRTRAFATAARFARDRHELDDLAQDIFLRVWKGLAGYRGDAPIEHWIMKIAVRTCYDFLRKNRKRREHEVLVDETPPDGGHTAASPPKTDATRRRRDAWDTVRQLLEQLKPEDRLVITLLDLEEKSVKEVAGLTGLSESNVKVRAHRARKKMRQIYETRFQLKP